METQHTYAGVIIASVNHVIGTFTTLKISNSEIHIPKKRELSCGITIHIGIYGDIEAVILMSMDPPTGLALASEMMGGMEMAEIDELVVSAVAEFCNIVIGNTCSNLNGLKLTLDITPPVVVSEKDNTLRDNTSSYHIAFHLCNLGDIDFDITLTKAVGTEVLMPLIV